MTVSATEAPAPAVPFEFFELEVVRKQRIGASMVRLTFGGAQLGRLVSGGKDQRFKLFLPHPGQRAPVVPTASDNWFTDWRAMDPNVRALMRTYTVRALRRTPQHPADELDVDFALHEGPAPGGGPASQWAHNASLGDPVTLLAPVVEDNGGVDFRPPSATDWVLLSGDETALPAIASILESLPAGTPARVFLEVPHPEDRQPLLTSADAEITWLVRDGEERHRTEAAVAAVREASLPSGTPYAWIAGEAGTVKALRRHLVRERGVDRRAVKFTGYWRLGTSEEQLLAEATANAPATA
ncbi:siderophore-interacting protein [Streptomyces xiaopingdaonensis]|uniref:siderophore-interacting protein n=1 Tax=Streptomyces xiaopingdaonensis TaxID=1565415 RepID=UPI000316BD4F|nr:siderophore-interacting protein [Streptomyces xiaopingdaonensis]